MFKNVGRTLILLRELRDLNQAQLARRARVGKSQISKYEKGREHPKLSVLERILVAMGYCFADFSQVLSYFDALDQQQNRVTPAAESSPSELPAFPGTPTAIPAVHFSPSTLLGPDVQKGFETIVQNVSALERNVFMSFVLYHTSTRRARDRTKAFTPAEESE